MLLTGPRNPHGGRGALLAGLALAQTVSWGTVYYTFSVLLPAMEDDLRASRTAIAGAFSVALLASAFAAPAVGRVIDGHGPRHLMSAGSVGAVVLLVAWSRVETLASLYAVWTGLGLVMAAVLYEPAFAVVAKWFGEDRNRALARLTLAGGLASTIFLPLAAHLESWLGWRTALLVLAAVLALTTIPIHAFLLPAAASPDGGERTPGATAPRAPAGRPSLAGLAALFLLTGFSTGAVAVHVVPHFVGLGLSSAGAALLAGWMGAMQVPGRLLFAAIGDRFSSASLTVAGLSLQLVAAVVLASRRPGAPALFAVLFGLAAGLLTLTRVALVVDAFGPARYGRVAGILAALHTGGRAAGPFAAALGYERLGGDRAVSTMLVLSSAVAVVVASVNAVRSATRRGPRRGDERGPPSPGDRLPPAGRGVPRSDAQARSRGRSRGLREYDRHVSGVH